MKRLKEGPTPLLTREEGHEAVGHFSTPQVGQRMLGMPLVSYDSV